MSRRHHAVPRHIAGASQCSGSKPRSSHQSRMSSTHTSVCSEVSSELGSVPPRYRCRGVARSSRMTLSMSMSATWTTRRTRAIPCSKTSSISTVPGGQPANLLGCGFESVAPPTAVPWPGPFRHLKTLPTAWNNFAMLVLQPLAHRKTHNPFCTSTKSSSNAGAS